MNKKLRLWMMAVMAVMGFGNAMAEDVIWQEDWSGWKDYVKVDPNGINSNYTFTGTTFKDDGSYNGGTGLYDDNLAGGEAPEMLVAKNGGTFTATIDLGGKSGDMTLTFKCNKNITITAEGATVGEKSGSGNDYSYPITGASGTIKLTFENPQSTNARLDNIKLFQGEGKKAAGLSWGTSSRTVTLGANDNVFPTLQNDNNLPVRYSSSETSVATIDGDGNITLVAAGQTVITAESEETAEFEAGHAQYTLTVKEGQSTPDPQPGEAITVAKALEIIAGLENGAKTDDKYEVVGFIVAIDEFSPKPDGYGNATFDISDEAGNTTSVLKAFRCKNIDGANFTTDDAPLAIGEKVTVNGQLQKYVKNDVITPELASGCNLVSRSTSTAISEVKANANDGIIFNLAGQQVRQAQKGLYIINGRKVVIK